MQTKNDRLGGEDPVDLVETEEGAARVLEYIHAYNEEKKRTRETSRSRDIRLTATAFDAVASLQ